MIQISFLVEVLWQKEPVIPLIIQQISELEVHVNLVAREHA